MEKNNIKVGVSGQNPTNPQLGAFEIAEGMTAEQMMPVFFNKDALREPPIRLYQLNSKGLRYYYFFDEEGKAQFMPSVTTVLHHTMPENVFLTDWKISLGKDKAAAYTAERANYGTFMHGCFERLLINRSYNLDELKSELAKYIEREQLPTSFIDYADSLKRDVLSFAAFITEYDVKPYAVEIALFSKQFGYAGMIDLVASIRKYPRSEERKAREKVAAEAAKAKDDDKKLEKLGEKLAEINRKAEEREVAIIDFKSGRKGFYEEHEIQLGMYRQMWNEWFPAIKVESLYNFSPKDWRKAPSFNFKSQTDSPNIAKIPALLELFALDGESEKEVTIVGGTIDLDSPVSTEECVKVVPLSELVKMKGEAGAEKPLEQQIVEAEEGK